MSSYVPSRSFDKGSPLIQTEHLAGEAGVSCTDKAAGTGVNKMGSEVSSRSPLAV